MLNKSSQQFEKFMYGLMGALAVVVVVFMVIANIQPPHVAQISIGQQVEPAAAKQILISFSRTMDHSSVEKSFSITPATPGKYSWTGRSFAFTPDKTLTYGTNYEIRIAKSAQDITGKTLDNDYVFDFITSPLQFAYIGTEGSEQNKLMLSNFDGSQRKALTDGTVKVEQFQFCPDNSCVYFLGYQQTQYQNHLDELYQLNLQSGNLVQLTDDKNFINKSFKLSNDGQTLALGRIQVSSSGQYLTPIEIWVAPIQNSAIAANFQLFENGDATGTEFFFSPDGSSLLYLDKNGNYELGPIPDFNQSSGQSADQKPQFIGTYDACYGFHPTQPIIAFTKDQTDGFFVLTNDLTLYNGDGSSETVPHSSDGGLFRDTVFSPDGQSLVTIFSGKNENFDDPNSLYPLRIFHLYQYDLTTKKIRQLTSDFNYSEEDPTVSPDSKYLLFQRYETFGKDVVIDPAYREVTDSLGNILSGGTIWMMNLDDKTLTQLPMKGTKLQFLN